MVRTSRCHGPKRKENPSLCLPYRHGWWADEDEVVEMGSGVYPNVVIRFRNTALF
jgi:hypothetical protein